MCFRTVPARTADTGIEDAFADIDRRDWQRGPTRRGSIPPRPTAR
ncbi:hypothetical protein [Natronococcus jeotgali]|nr:hypothetical protein [Natronococcus jeotgali]